MYLESNYPPDLIKNNLYSKENVFSKMQIRIQTDFSSIVLPTLCKFSQIWQVSRVKFPGRSISLSFKVCLILLLTWSLSIFMPISPGMLFLQIVCVKGISGLVRIDIIFYRQKIHENQAIEIGNSLNHVVSEKGKKWSLSINIHGHLTRNAIFTNCVLKKF